MFDKTLYILAGYDAETEKRITQMQENLFENGFSGTQTKIEPHITVGDFPSDAKTEAALGAQLRALAENTAPFAVTFNHIGVFGGSRVLFVAPDTSAALLKLKENFGSAYNWTPHTTLLIDEPDVIYRALPAAMEHFSAFAGQVTKLHLYEFFPSRHILTVEF